MPNSKKFSEPRSDEEIFWPSKGARGHALPENFNIKGPRLAKNAFPEISAWKN